MENLKDLCKEMGAVIREKRIEKNMTSAQFSALTGTTESWVRKVEGGKPLSLGTLADFCKAIDCDLIITFEPKDDREPSNDFYLIT